MIPNLITTSGLVDPRLPSKTINNQILYANENEPKNTEHEVGEMLSCHLLLGFEESFHFFRITQ